MPPMVNYLLLTVLCILFLEVVVEKYQLIADGVVPVRMAVSTGTGDVVMGDFAGDHEVV